MIRATSAALALLSLASAGCYAHVPVDPGEVAPGADVRVRVSTTEAERLEREAQIYDRVFRARVLEADPSNLLLRVPVPETSPRISGRLYNRVAVTPRELVELEVRELDKPRTFLAIGAGVAAVTVAAVYAFADPEEGEGDEKEPGEPTNGILSIPLLSWIFR